MKLLIASLCIFQLHAMEQSEPDLISQLTSPQDALESCSGPIWVEKKPSDFESSNQFEEYQRKEALIAELRKHDSKKVDKLVAKYDQELFKLQKKAEEKQRKENVRTMSFLDDTAEDTTPWSQDEKKKGGGCTIF